MEYINKVELRGIVGTVRKSDIGEHTLTKMSVCTNHVYLNSSGSTVVESTWHYVTAWNLNKEVIEHLDAGSKVHIKGRLTNNRYTTSDGEERTTISIIAHLVEVLSDEQTSYQTTNPNIK